MRLSTLLAALPPTLAASWASPPSPDAPGAGAGGDAPDPVIRGIDCDSRRVVPGHLFVALRGATTDGHAHLADAEARGAVAHVVEALPDDFTPKQPVVVVPDSRRALAVLSVRFFGDPSAELRLVGITGTNGKTSTSFLVDAMLRAAGVASGIIGTLGSRAGDDEGFERSLNTTPESLDLQRTLRSMRNRGVDAVAMEVSSHGLELGRVDGCRFEVAAVTNLTQDHLDFHGSIAAYRDAKCRLFLDHLRDSGSAVVNVDDAHSGSFLEASASVGARTLRVSSQADAAAEVRTLSARVGADGTEARLVTPRGELEVSLPLVGGFNVENLCVAVGIGEALGLPHEAMARGVAACPQVPGRVERVDVGIDAAPRVLVDYAHTPDAVEKLLATLRPLTRGRLVALFGCGGDRDRAKRPLMAEAVARHADLAIATSDNPRTEDPLAILRDVEPGLQALEKVAPETLASHQRACCVVPDRREAIALAIAVGGPEDTVVLAGKGHEDYQIVGTERLPFDDRLEARRALRARFGATERAR